jgi:hypothetical protein
MSYIPKVNDYVQWKNHEGWVNFVDEQHIAIERGTSSKKDIKNGGTHHQKNHILLVCPNYQWK